MRLSAEAGVPRVTRRIALLSAARLGGGALSAALLTTCNPDTRSNPPPEPSPFPTLTPRKTPLPTGFTEQSTKSDTLIIRVGVPPGWTRREGLGNVIVLKKTTTGQQSTEVTIRDYTRSVPLGNQVLDTFNYIVNKELVPRGFVVVFQGNGKPERVNDTLSLPYMQGSITTQGPNLHFETYIAGTGRGEIIGVTLVSNVWSGPVDDLREMVSTLTFQ